MKNTKNKPLSNLLVLDLTRVLAGPYATMVLSDLGARVVKIEPPVGDDSRSFGPFVNGVSTYFASLNKGKESIKVDFKKSEDKNLFFDLVKHADIVVENFRPGTMNKLGINKSKLKKINSKIIIASCSGFGQTGPWAKKPAYDLIVQALGGIMSLTGIQGKQPVRVGSSIGDIIAGLFLVIGIQAALIKRKETGVGETIDISMLDCQIAMLENAIARFDSEKKIPQKQGSRHPSISPFECYKCKDDYIAIAAGNDNLFKKLCECIGNKKICFDKKYSTNNNRLQNAEALKKEIENFLKDKNSKFWIKKLENKGIPVAKVNNIKEAINLKQVKARNMLVNVQINKNKKLKVAGNPIKMSNLEESRFLQKVPELDSNRNSIIREFKISRKKC